MTPTKPPRFILAVFLISLLVCHSYHVVGAGKSSRQTPPAGNVSSSESAQRPLVAIQPAPEFSLKNVFGGEVNSSYLKGKVVVVEFWATWAVPSKAAIPEYNRMRRELRDKGVEFLAVTFDSGSSVEDVRPIVQALNMEYPVVMGTDAVEAGFGGSPGYPTTFLVGKDWKVYRRIFGSAPNKIPNLERDIRALLAKAD